MNIKLIKNLCSQPENKLKSLIYKFISSNPHYKEIHINSNYIIAEGELPICLVAHMDTVFNYLPHEFLYDHKKKVLIAPGGAGFDDRVGIYLILQAIEKGYYPSVIFTQGEEVGGVGARALVSDFPECPFEDCRALIQLDRANHNDAVFYDCENKDFEKFIYKHGFKFDWGTFSDISIIAPAWKIAAVNLSVGYVDEHSAIERLYCNWTDDTFKKLCKILEHSVNMKSYTYIPHVYHIPQNDGASYTPMFNDTFNDYHCIICDKDFEEGRYVYDSFGRSYNVCEECFQKYHEPLTPNIKMRKCQPIPF